jgi:ammonium transporter Rh
VAIGAVADFSIGLATVSLIGSLAGLLSTYGFARIQPMLERRGLYDTAGIHNLHAMPSLLGGVASVIAVSYMQV